MKLRVLTLFLAASICLCIDGIGAAQAEGTRDCIVRYKENLGRGDLFPPACVGSYVIGNPAKKTSPDAYSGFDNPDEVGPRKGFYSISCAAAQTGEVEIFRGWNNGPASPEKRFVDRAYTLGVLYFFDDGERQFIYGTIITGRAKSDGLPVIAHSKDWTCELFKP